MKRWEWSNGVVLVFGMVVGGLLVSLIGGAGAGAASAENGRGRCRR